MVSETNCKTTNIVLAVAFASAGSVVSAIGYVIEKKAHIQVNQRNYELSISQICRERDSFGGASNSNISNLSTKSFVTNKLWCSGFFIYIIGSIFQAAALKFGAQSVVAPLGSLTLVANTILATKFLNEPFNLNDILGTLFIVIGSTLAVIFGPRADCINPSITELKQNYLKTEFLIFLISLTVMTLIDFIGTKYLECINYSIKEKQVVNACAKQTADDPFTIVEISKSKQLFLMLSYVFIAAYFGSINVLLMKSTVIILYTLSREYITEWYFWTMIVSVIVVNVCLEYFRQRALKYFGALFVIPIYQVLLVIGSILMGAMYFDEFGSISLYCFVFFVIAIGIIVVGIGFMAFNFGSNVQKDVKQNNSGLSAKMLSP